MSHPVNKDGGGFYTVGAGFMAREGHMSDSVAAKIKKMERDMQEVQNYLIQLYDTAPKHQKNIIVPDVLKLPTPKARARKGATVPPTSDE